MELLSNLMKQEPKTVQTVNHIEVIDINGYTAIKEKDMVVCIPYLVEQNSILLRYENIPTFNLNRPEINKFVNVMSTVIDTHESPLDALKRGLLTEYSIQLKKENVEILNPIFINKGNTASYHICILPLMTYEYEMIQPTDVKELEMKDNNIILNIMELKNIIIYDLITRYCLDLFKQHYSLF